jgi:hypothetical protein
MADGAMAGPRGLTIREQQIGTRQTIWSTVLGEFSADYECSKNHQKSKQLKTSIALTPFCAKVIAYRACAFETGRSLVEIDPITNGSRPAWSH